MKKVATFFLLVMVSGCPDELELIRVECLVGESRECHWSDNSTQIALGACKLGVQKCTHSGWGACVGAQGPSEEVCDGIDNNCNGQTDEQFLRQYELCGFEENVSYGVGICKPGLLICKEGYLFCEGHQGPYAEVCDGLDNDCNGTVDDQIPNQTALVCYEGPPGTLHIGECRAGIQYCERGDYGICDGQVLPTEEFCDAKDNDCDGEIDEGLSERPVDIVFVIDISGSFDDEIQSMIEGITPLLDDPITSNFRFGLSVIGSQNTGGGTPLLTRYSKVITDFVPADEFLEYLEGIRLLPGGGIEPSIDAPMWIMNGSYAYSWASGSQKVIIIMTDEEAQTVTATPIVDVNQMAIDGNFEIFVFALPQHHNVFLGLVRGEQDRLYSPSVNSATVFQQIRDIFDDLCVGG